MSEKRRKTALFLGGGAPNFTLMSGALLALHQKGIRFDIVSMAGAGAVVGLMYLAPKTMTPEEALENTVNFAISDEIYSMFPVNYKAFSKWGPSADAFNKYWFSLPAVQAAAHQYGKTSAQKLRDDWLLMLGSMLCPTDLNYASKGLSEHPHFIDNLIDFEILPDLKQQIELNAFRLSDRTVVDFTNHEITPDHLRAALSFPFIYAPYKIGDEYYYEGAAFQCINPTRVSPEEIDHFVVLQPMSSHQIQPPRNLWDAYSQSVMMPVAALAQLGTDAVEEASTITVDPQALAFAIGELGRSNSALGQMLSENEPHVLSFIQDVVNNAVTRTPSTSGCIPLSLFFPKIKDKWFEATFDIAEERLPYVFDWSRSNLEYLFDLGYVTGEDLADELYDEGEYVPPT
jgi:predicted acylesterase/phospholipase RssA